MANPKNPPYTTWYVMPCVCEGGEVRRVVSFKTRDGETGTVGTPANVSEEWAIRWILEKAANPGDKVYVTDTPGTAQQKANVYSFIVPAADVGA